MNLKEQVELRLLRELARRLSEILEENLQDEWRQILIEGLRARPISFDVQSDGSEDPKDATDVALNEVARLVGLDPRTLH